MALGARVGYGLGLRWGWFVASLALLALAGCGEQTPRLQAGDAAPTFDLPRLASGQARFPEDFRGRPVVLRFWADWCPYCRKEMAEIESIYQRHQGQGLVVLAVNVGQERETVGNFVRQLNISYETLLDERSETARKYGVTGLPTTFFLDREGKVRGKILGEADAALFEQRVAELLR